MKISLARDVLFSQLGTVSRVASTRSAIQALSGVQLTAGAGGCELRATDMDVGLRVPTFPHLVRWWPLPTLCLWIPASAGMTKWWMAEVGDDGSGDDGVGG